MSRLGSIVSFAAMQLAWYACVGGAARGIYWAGPIAMFGSLVLRLALRKSLGRSRMWLYLGVSSLLGFVLDSVFLRLGFFALADGSLWSPLWLVALWPSLALCVGKDGELSWLEGRPWLGAAIGAVFGPLAYASGARMGAVHEGTNPARALLLIGAAWALVLPVLSALRSKMASPVTE